MCFMGSLLSYMFGGKGEDETIIIVIQEEMRTWAKELLASCQTNFNLRSPPTPLISCVGSCHSLYSFIR